MPCRWSGGRAERRGGQGEPLTLYGRDGSGFGRSSVWLQSGIGLESVRNWSGFSQELAWSQSGIGLDSCWIKFAFGLYLVRLGSWFGLYTLSILCQMMVFFLLGFLLEAEFLLLGQLVWDWRTFFELSDMLANTN